MPDAIIQVKVLPKSSRNQVLGKEGEIFRIKLTAPPLEGRANKALMDLLSKRLGVPKKDVEIVSGRRSRLKSVRIQGLTQADVNIQLSHFFETPPASPVPSSEIYRSDQDGDGAIGSADWTICIRNSGKVGDLYHPMPTIETLGFTVAYQGRDNSAGRTQNVPIKVIIEKLATGQVLFESDWVPVTPASGSDNWGTASVDVSSAGLIPGRSYEVFVKGAMHLAKRTTVALTDGMTVDYTDPHLNPDGVLPAGDINQDNRVTTMEDIGAVFSHYGEASLASPDPSSEVNRCDLDGDGKIGWDDVVICLHSPAKGDPY